MVARLEWIDGKLQCGKIVLAQVRYTNKHGWQWMRMGFGWNTQIPRCDSDAVARQDCESAVRRLLKEAGCEVEHLHVR